MKAKEKRNSRSYKSTDKVYKKAMRVAKNKKQKLSQVIELFIEDYGNDKVYFKDSGTVLGQYKDPQ